jgi:hypothetical protein
LVLPDKNHKSAATNGTGMNPNACAKPQKP